MKHIKDFKIYIFLFIPLVIIAGCLAQRKINTTPVVVSTTPANGMYEIELEFHKGKSFNYPSFAVWVEDMEGNYIETLYVTLYVAKGEFRYGEMEPGKWKNEPGLVRRAASLPYWAHKRNIAAPDGLFIPSPETAVPDALTSATPKGNFLLQTHTSYKEGKNFRILMEINQPWDSNEFWTNNRFPGDLDYTVSLQPAIVYAVTIERQESDEDYFMNPIGHSHPSGENGRLFTDLSTLTSAKDIARKISVRLKHKSNT